MNHKKIILWFLFIILLQVIMFNNVSAYCENPCSSCRNYGEIDEERNRICDESRGFNYACNTNPETCCDDPSICAWRSLGPIGPICGNGNIETGEECDDGNRVTETCDYGELNCQVCDASCQLISGETFYCGDGTINSNFGEECDDGNTITEQCNYGELNCQVCDASCQLISGETFYCGDGVINTQYGEECDDQNTNDIDCCSNSCKLVDAPDASKTEGVCQGQVKLCVDGNWEDPNFTTITSYQETETLCDNKDNDCDGLIDEGLTSVYYLDLDGDGYGDINSEIYQLCTETNSAANNNLDCDDNNNTIHPNANEICGNNIDEDCSGTPDDNCPCLQGDAYCNNRQGVCSGYQQICGSDGKIPVCDWSSIENYEQNEISCDSLDNDCDGLIDEGCDDDKDGYADSSMRCHLSFIDGNKNQKYCSGHENDCDDLLSKVHPGYPEICDGIDNNCDNIIDNVPEEETPFCHEVMSVYNNVGVCENKKATCNYQRYKGWYCPLNEFFSTEICSDKLDNDCDGLIDEGCTCNSGEERICGSDLGECKQGIQKCVNSRWGDCEDSINPSDEICDNLDNDCDGLIDEDITKECTSNEGCSGIQKCYLGSWLECEATCDNLIKIELNNDDFGKFVIEAKLDKEDVKNSLETLEVVNQSLTFSSSGNTINLKNTINPKNELKDFDYNLYIPKCLTPYLEQIEFENKDYKIIKEDPLIAWHFANVNDKINLNYKVKGQIDESCLEQIKGLPIAKVIGAELGKTNQVRTKLIKFIVIMWLIFLSASSVIYIGKRNPATAKKTEQDYEKEFIEREKNILLKKIKAMKFKSKEQAKHHMENLGISDEIKEWILKKL